MKFKIYKIICFLFGHIKVESQCKRCLTQFGVPLMRNPPSPPVINTVENVPKELVKVVEMLNKDEYDMRFGKWLEYGFDTPEEYYKVKNFVIKSGRWDEAVSKDNHHKNQ